MKKHQIIEGTIENYDFPNKGSFVYEDRKVTVKGAFAGQKISCAITKLQKDKASGRLISVISKSPFEDANPTCPHFGMCGGCTYQTFSYEHQLAIKEDLVHKLVDGAVNAAHGNFCQPDVETSLKAGAAKENGYIWEGIIGSPIQHAYRNKMEFSFGDEYKDGPLALGLHRKNSIYDIVNITDCDIISTDYNEIVKYTLDYCTKLGLPYYKKMQHEGLLRYLVIRQSMSTGEILVNLVTTTRHMEKLQLEKYAQGLLSLPLSGKIAGILHTEDDSFADAVISDRTTLIYGTDHIYENMLGLKFKISPFSFFQTNTSGAEQLYSKVREYVGETRDKIIFDLYSGTGTIAQMLAPVAKKVIGVEIVREAVEAAKENAGLNNLTNCEFIAGDVLKVLDEIEEKPDIIVIDPPRDGVNPKALDKIIKFGVQELVYISCKPTSLARDLAVLQKQGYKVVRACAIDQFCYTVHCETVVKLSLKTDTPKFEVIMEPDEEHYYTPEEKVTYQKIKEYVFEKYEFAD